jgi:1,4-dihydroxy-2-naphthoate octaprenyltransferase
MVITNSAHPGLYNIFKIVKLARLPIAIPLLPCYVIGVLFAMVNGEALLIENVIWGFMILFLNSTAAAYANDYYDYEGDKYNEQFGFSGGSGVLLEHPELRLFAKWGAVFLFVLSLLLTVVFIWLAALPIWTIGYIAIGVFFFWFYTAPPIKLCYRGLGEPPHLLAGIMLPGWGYLVVAGTLDLILLIFAIPIGIFFLTVILNFEIPDKEADIHGGKKNLIVKKGRRFSFKFVMVLYLLSTIYFTFLALSNWLADRINFWVIAFISLIPLVVTIYSSLHAPDDKSKATPYAIINAVSSFLYLSLSTLYLIYLVA